MGLRISVIALLLLLTGCSSLPKIINNWPQELPPIEVFLDAYENDLENKADQSIENYLVWVKRFYQGWVVYDNGWLNMSLDLANKVEDPVQRAFAQKKINKIGLLIAPEWAKEKESRYIHTRDVVVWGESLLEGLSRGDVLNLMDSVIADIGLLKKGSISSGSITIGRYFPDLAEDEDDGFFF